MQSIRPRLSSEPSAWHQYHNARRDNVPAIVAYLFAVGRCREGYALSHDMLLRRIAPERQTRAMAHGIPRRYRKRR